MAVTSLDNADVRSDAGQVNTLQSTTVRRRLNQVDSIRSKGVGDHIELPQLVVCGAQSAGKSSVLEGITGIPFPRQDGVCTKFATEIILRHSQTESSINATIIPHKGRDELEAGELRSFQRCLAGYEELPAIITDAAIQMGIRGFGHSGHDAPAFAADVLCIEVIGDIGLHLTVVDLPGLISVDETAGEDVRLVEGLVDSYLQSSRTIILAVVQATNDIVTEPIIQRARYFDCSGERTVGIITKPDLINKGTEGRIASFTNNLDNTKLKLGYFLLKNPSPHQLADGIRNRDEMEFFQSHQWKEHGVNLDRVGIDALRSFLQGLLEEHIERELPKVCDEIDRLLKKTQDELHELGEKRSTIADQRFFLSKLSTEFHRIIEAALSGTYQDATSDFFGYGDKLPQTRLRARLHELNSLFADYMRERSQKCKPGSGSRQRPDEVGWFANGDQEAGEEKVLEVEEEGDPKHNHLEKGSDAPRFLRKSEFDTWVKTVSVLPVHTLEYY